VLVSVFAVLASCTRPRSVFVTRAEHTSCFDACVESHEDDDGDDGVVECVAACPGARERPEECPPLQLHCVETSQTDVSRTVWAAIGLVTGVGLVVLIAFVAHSFGFGQ
jgi:hypothetical protein